MVWVYLPDFFSLVRLTKRKTKHLHPGSLVHLGGHVLEMLPWNLAMKDTLPMKGVEGIRDQRSLWPYNWVVNLILQKRPNQPEMN